MRGLGVALVLLSAACGAEAPPAPATPQAPSYPPGTVLLVEDQPLFAADVEPLSADILELYPEYSPIHARRLALTNVWLPRLACRARYPEAWAAARAACAAASDGLDAASPDTLEGSFGGLGVGLWSEARHLSPGTWSGPIEQEGRWLRLRLDERVPADDPREEVLRLSLIAFPYVDPSDPHAQIEAAIDGARLTLVDPRFSEAVPEAWKLRMRGSQP